MCIKENNFDKSKLNINSLNKVEKKILNNMKFFEIENKDDFN